MTADFEIEEHRIQPPEWLDKSFLENALREGLKTPQLSLSSYHIKPATAAGDNYASQMFRAKLEIIKKPNSPPEQLSIVMKTNALGKASEMMEEISIFEKEAKMLQVVLPEINAMLHKIDPKQQPLSANCLYFSKKPDNIIILEDLGELGFTNADRMNGLDISLTNMVLESLGKYHAASVAINDRCPEKFDTFREGIWTEKNKDMMQPMINSAVEGLLEAASTWPDFSQEHLGILSKLKDTIYDSLWASNKFDENEINVLQHGDCWINNFMFSFDQGKAKGFRFVDFQLPSVHSAALDLNYFIFTSPSALIRLEKLDDMLATYFNTFMATIKALNVTLPRPYTLEELKANFKKRLFFGFIATIVVYPITVCPKSNAPDVNDFFEESNSKSYLYQTETFKKVFKLTLPYFIENGAL